MPFGRRRCPCGAADDVVSSLDVDASAVSDATDCLQLVLHDAPCEAGHAHAVCLPPDAMRPPFTVEWQVDGCTVAHGAVGVDGDTGLTASRLPSRCEFAVLVTDCQGTKMRAHARACVRDTPCVTSYQTWPASSAVARDGRVRAVVENLATAAGDGGGATAAGSGAEGGAEGGQGAGGVRFLWTTGACTSEPELRFVGAGRYTVALVREDEGDAGDAGATPVEFVHVCAPAKVGVAPTRAAEEEA